MTFVESYVVHLSNKCHFDGIQLSLSLDMFLNDKLCWSYCLICDKLVINVYNPTGRAGLNWETSRRKKFLLPAN